MLPAPPPPPALELADFDFETYSEAGYTWDEAAQKWRPLLGHTRGGLFAVGAYAYAEHPSTELLSLAYDLKDGRGPRLWLPGMAPPQDLFDYLAAGGLLEAWNVEFEATVWDRVCSARMGWPALPVHQLRDAMVKARANGWPGGLGKAADALGAEEAKDSAGTALLNRFSRPRNPTKNNPALRTYPHEDPKGPELWGYNVQDIKAEAAVSALIPDLPPAELEFWQVTMAGNRRGVGVDLATVDAAIAILEQAYAKYNAELRAVTGGEVTEASKVQDLLKWCAGLGWPMENLDEAAIKAELAHPELPPDIRRALEIRQAIGSAGVKKVYAMRRQATADGRLKGLFIYHGARTGRDTGADVQPQNLVKAGPAVKWCPPCGQPYGQHLDTCPHCAAPSLGARVEGWCPEAQDAVAAALQTRSLDWVEYVWGDAVLAVSGIIRGLFVAAPGHDLICSDYSSIEAVVTAMLAGEQWRVEAFERGDDIYLTSAGKIRGHSLEWYAANGGKSHPDRQKIGKPAELGLGFGGWIAAWRQFDKSDEYTDEEVKRLIMDWREASPAIVELWGGQVRGKPWAPERQELYGLEGMAIKAVQNPGTVCTYRLISYLVEGETLYCILPSGRRIAYQRPQLEPSHKWDGQLQITFEGWNSNPKMGPIGWHRMSTYGGRLTENAVQATARDIMAYATVNLERAGYPWVLRVHDEIAAEVPQGFGSVEEFEQIMATLPKWAEGWPIRAAGGWRGRRYRKD